MPYLARTEAKNHVFVVTLHPDRADFAANAAAMNAGATFIDSQLFQINEQKYFASTDGSYIDQDIHRIWPTFTVTASPSVRSLCSRHLVHFRPR